MRRDQIERGNRVVAVKVGFGLLELQPAEAGEWEEVPPDGNPLTSSPEGEKTRRAECRTSG